MRLRSVTLAAVLATTDSARRLSPPDEASPIVRPVSDHAPRRTSPLLTFSTTQGRRQSGARIAVPGLSGIGCASKHNAKSSEFQIRSLIEHNNRRGHARSALRADKQACAERISARGRQHVKSRASLPEIPRRFSRLRQWRGRGPPPTPRGPNAGSLRAVPISSPTASAAAANSGNASRFGQLGPNITAPSAGRRATKRI